MNCILSDGENKLRKLGLDRNLTYYIDFRRRRDRDIPLNYKSHCCKKNHSRIPFFLFCFFFLDNEAHTQCATKILFLGAK